MLSIDQSLFFCFSFLGWNCREHLQTTAEDITAVGQSTNDWSMFCVLGLESHAEGRAEQMQELYQVLNIWCKNCIIRYLIYDAHTCIHIIFYCTCTQNLGVESFYDTLLAGYDCAFIHIFQKQLIPAILCEPILLQLQRQI